MGLCIKMKKYLSYRYSNIIKNMRVKKSSIRRYILYKNEIIKINKKYFINNAVYH